MASVLPGGLFAQEIGVSAAFNNFTKAVSLQKVFEQPRVFGAFDLKLGFKAEGTEYADLFGNPHVGVGFSYANIGSCRQAEGVRVGDTYTLYAFFHRPLLSTRAFSLGYSVEFGPAFMNHWFDPVENPKNNLYSGPLTMHSKLGIYALFNLSDRFSIGAEMAFRHNSTGRLYVPNEGLNSYSMAVSARYAVGDRVLHPGEKIAADSPFGSKFRMSVFAGGGIHKCMADYLVDRKLPAEERKKDFTPWFKGSAGVEGIWRYSRKCSLGVQAELFYLSNTEALRVDDNIIKGEAERKYSPLSAGIGITQEVYFGSFTVGAGIGAYLYREVGFREDHGRLYQKVCLRYHPPFLSSYFGGISIRAHQFGRADYIEFSLGRIIASWN